MRYNRFLIAVLVLLVAGSCKKNSSEPGTSQNPSDLKVLGYLYSDNNWNADLSADLSQLTDLNLAFVNPDEDGGFSLNSDVANLVTRAHQKNVRIFISIGGGGPHDYILALLNDDKRPTLVSNLAALTDQYNFDGVDVDLEGDYINENYADFVSELSAALKSKNKIITAALATWEGDFIHDSTLNQFDFINVMSYDKTGPWDPSNPGPHSPYEMAEHDAHYFVSSRSVDAKKILIGLPFYGYGFGGNAPESITYRDIVGQYAGAENKDMVDVAGGGKIYYNGIPTIVRKVHLAIDLGAAGVMIWEINQDSRYSKSLLKAINDNKSK